MQDFTISTKERAKALPGCSFFGKLVWVSGLMSIMAAQAAANPFVDGSAIRWTGSDWYQVQSAIDFRPVCEGGNACHVLPGVYHVINLTSGERFENIQVGESATPQIPVTGGNNSNGNPANNSGGNSAAGATNYANGIVENAGTISWTESGWHQVQSMSDFSSVCEGGSSCVVPAGNYVVINHSTGQRTENIRVGSGGTSVGSGSGTTSGTSSSEDDFVITGNTIEFLNNDWFQVQRASDFVTVCQGESSCDLPTGTYNVINHSSSQRFNGVQVGTVANGTNTPPPPSPPASGSTSAEPVASGSEIQLFGGDYYQVQSALDFSTVCEGNINSCSVADGLYTVINHSSGERFNDIRVGAGPAPDIYSLDSADPFNSRFETLRASAPTSGIPSQPQNLRIELISNDWVEFNWSPSADNGEVVAYNIYRDSTAAPLYVLERGMTHPNPGVAAELAKLWSTSSFIDCNRTRFYNEIFFCNGGPNGEAARGPEVGASHTYYVSAVDNNGNESVLSEPLNVQLYSQSGAPVQPYRDPHLLPANEAMYEQGIGSPANFLNRFQLVFDEEFNGSQLDRSKWNSRLVWGPDVTINDEQQYFVDILNEPDFGYDPFEFTGSTLKIVASKTPAALLGRANGMRYLSGALSSFDRFGFTYGYTEARMKFSGVFGALSTFYLYHRYPANHAPEIDIAEYLGYNRFGDEDVFQTYHYHDSQYPSNGIIRSTSTMSHRNESGALYADAFHTFGALWEPGLVAWYIDGVEVRRIHGPQVGRQSMNVITYLVTGSAWPAAPDQYVPADDLDEMRDDIVNLPLKLEDDYPLELEIDYIRVWQLPERVGN